MLQLETPGTLRARELGEIYMILASDADEDGAEGEERLPALHSLAGIVSYLKEHESYIKSWLYKTDELKMLSDLELHTNFRLVN